MTEFQRHHNNHNNHGTQHQLSHFFLPQQPKTDIFAHLEKQSKTKANGTTHRRATASAFPPHSPESRKHLPEPANHQQVAIIRPTPAPAAINVDIAIDIMKNTSQECDFNHPGLRNFHVRKASLLFAIVLVLASSHTNGSRPAALCDALVTPHQRHRSSHHQHQNAKVYEVTNTFSAGGQCHERLRPLKASSAAPSPRGDFDDGSIVPPGLSSPQQDEQHLQQKKRQQLRARLQNLLSSRVLRPLRRQRQQQRSAKNDKSYGWTKQNLSIAMPALLGLLADPILSLVDTAFVGRISAVDLAALGVCTSIFHMTFTIFRASTVATTSLVGSAETKQEARQITKISLQLAGLLGSMVLMLLRFGGPAILSAMGAHPTSPLYKPAQDYLFARCWAAPAVVGIVVAEGAFRGSGDSKTPLLASTAAALVNLILDPLFMFPMKMGMVGAAAATALSQFGAAIVYWIRMQQKKLLPQPADKEEGKKVDVVRVVKAILGANLAMFAKSGSMLFFYSLATAQATRMGPIHVAAHQVALSFWWMTTFWLDSGSVSGQVLMSKSMTDKPKARSLTKYMAKYSLLQGVGMGTLVALCAKIIPAIFTSDATVQAFIGDLIPYMAVQQVLVSVTLCLEGLVLGDSKQFRFMGIGTAIATLAGMRQLLVAKSVIDIWSNAMNVFFAGRLINATIGLIRVHRGINASAGSSTQTEAAPIVREVQAVQQ